jgi:hypothetical protein
MTTTEQPRCQCSVALPTGALGPCGTPARWRVTGHYVRPHLCCDECRQEWERIADRWSQPLVFTPLAPGG